MAKHSETLIAAKVCVPALLQSICQDLQLFPSMRGVGCRGGGGEGAILISKTSNNHFTIFTLVCVVVHSVTCIQSRIQSRALLVVVHWCFHVCQLRV